MTTEITCEELRQKLENNDKIAVIDVREPSEFAAGSIGGALLIPLGELESKIKDFNFPQEKEIIVYCRSGHRSQTAAGILKKLGYENAKSLKGGLFDWENKF